VNNVNGEEFYIYPFNNCHIHSDVAKYFEVIPETVGVKLEIDEVNEKEVYSGDICKVHVFTQELGENMGVMEGEKEFIAEICFSHDIGISFKGKDDNDSGPIWAYGGFHEESIEKIGNKFDNPDLIKE
jgi:hypothetical protein